MQYVHKTGLDHDEIRSFFGLVFLLFCMHDKSFILLSRWLWVLDIIAAIWDLGDYSDDMYICTYNICLYIQIYGIGYWSRK